MKTLFLSFFIITGVLSQLQGQVIAKWTMLRLFDPVTPSIYLNGEWNAYKSSNKKTLQGSLGYGFWGNLQENERNITQTKTIRLGLEHRYYFQEKFNGRYISVGIETRNAFYDAEEWETVCPTNDCFEQLKSQRFIRNSYSLTFKLGKMRHVGSNIYFENYIGMGVKFSKKTGTNSEIDDIYILKKDHYLFPMLSCGIRLGYMFKPKE
ncbi:MAG: DUF3575 domain-containing protein [Raineya sp.]|nr:DUF3575 domain-containing protein [Raineya sp.]